MTLVSLQITFCVLTSNTYDWILQQNKSCGWVEGKQREMHIVK